MLRPVIQFRCFQRFDWAKMHLKIKETEEPRTAPYTSKWLQSVQAPIMDKYLIIHDKFVEDLNLTVISRKVFLKYDGGGGVKSRWSRIQENTNGLIKCYGIWEIQWGLIGQCAEQPKQAAELRLRLTISRRYFTKDVFVCKFSSTE